MFELEKKVLKSHLGDGLYKELKASRCFIAGGMITSIFTKKILMTLMCILEAETLLMIS